MITKRAKHAFKKPTDFFEGRDTRRELMNLCRLEKSISYKHQSGKINNQRCKRTAYTVITAKLRHNKGINIFRTIYTSSKSPDKILPRTIVMLDYESLCNHIEDLCQVLVERIVSFKDHEAIKISYTTFVKKCEVYGYTTEANSVTDHTIPKRETTWIRRDRCSEDRNFHKDTVEFILHFYNKYVQQQDITPINQSNSYKNIAFISEKSKKTQDTTGIDGAEKERQQTVDDLMKKVINLEIPIQNNTRKDESESNASQLQYSKNLNLMYTKGAPTHTKKARTCPITRNKFSSNCIQIDDHKLGDHRVSGCSESNSVSVKETRTPKGKRRGSNKFQRKNGRNNVLSKSFRMP